MVKRIVLFVIIIAGLASSIVAQEISEKQDIAIFRLNYYGAPPSTSTQEIISITAEIGRGSVNIELKGSGDPNTDRIFHETIGGVDAEIREVFVNLRRFNIIGMEQRVTDSNLQDFVNAIQSYREGRVEIPEAVRLGQEAFTEQDLNKLIDSFIIVVPRVTYYQLIQDESLDWEAEIVTSFSIMNIETNTAIAEFSIESSGYDNNPQEAMRSAVDGISGQLNFRIRSIDEFKIRSAILERMGQRLVMEFGTNMGIMVGDEFEVTRLDFFAGRQVPRRIALIKLREVNSEYSIADIVYEKEQVVPGDQVKEVPRVGVDVTPYVGGLYDVTNNTLGSFAVGLKAAPNRGFYSFKYLLGFELIFSDASVAGPVQGVPISVLLGAQYDLFLGRLRIIPQAILGIIGQIPTSDEEDFYFRGIKAGILAGVGYLLPTAGDNIELYIEGGYEIQFGLQSSSVIHGVSFGAGVRIR